MFLIKIVFILAFLGLFMFFMTAWRTWRHVDKTVNKFNRRPHSSRSSSRTKSGDTIIDTRSPEKANRKIFKKSEGEYVDFVEKD